MNTTKPTQQELDTFVNNHVYMNQTMLVEYLLQSDIPDFTYEEIINFAYNPCTECGGELVEIDRKSVV
jgi:hypothetical protein